MILVSQPTEGVEETMHCGAGQTGAQQHSANKKDKHDDNNNSKIIL